MSIAYLNRKGEPITMEQWSTLLNDDDYKIIEQTAINADIKVSTVWLGLVHIGGFFETMIFGGHRDQDLWRYYTEKAARRGHKDIVAMVKRDLEDD